MKDLLKSITKMRKKKKILIWDLITNTKTLVLAINLVEKYLKWARALENMLVTMDSSNNTEDGEGEVSLESDH